MAPLRSDAGWLKGSSNRRDPIFRQKKGGRGRAGRVGMMLLLCCAVLYHSAAAASG